MKTKITTFAFIAFASITSHLFAQEATLKTRTKSNQTNELTPGGITASDDWQQQNSKPAPGQHIKDAVLVCRVTSSESGCSFTFQKIEWKYENGKASVRKQGQTPIIFTVSSLDNSVAEVKSPRDAASGLATGKRMHKPLTLTKEYDKSSPKLAEAVAKGRSSSDLPPSEIAIDEPGVQKVSMQDFHFTMSCGGKTTQIACVDGTCEIPIGECPNGTCSAIASWSWGVSNSGSTMSSSGSGRCAVDFLLEIEDGACTAMAINEKGLPGDKKPKKTTTNNSK